MPDLIAAMESALAKFSAREVLQPVRSVLTVGPTKAYFGLMPAYVPAPASLGAKLVTVFGENHKTRPAVAPRDDPAARSGDRRAAGDMDGRYITEARTAAVSACRRASWRGPTRRRWRSSAAACRRAAISRRISSCAS